MDWSDIRIFLAVAREKTALKASKSLDINHSTVSRRISTFEQYLGVRLFDRKPTGYELTGAGRDILKSAEVIEAETIVLSRRVFNHDAAPKGVLRVSTTIVVANQILVPCLDEFMGTYPEIQLDISLDDAIINLDLSDVDIAFRVTKNPPENAVGKRLLKCDFAIYASRDYLDRNGFDESNINIEKMRWISCYGPYAKMVEQLYPEQKAQCSLGSLVSVNHAVKSGMGIALLPCFLGERTPELVKLSDYHASDLSIWVLTHPDLRKTARVNLFRDFVINSIRSRTDLLNYIV